MIKEKGNKKWLLQKDYNGDLRKSIKITDNGNGLTIKKYSWMSSSADQYWSIDYGTAVDLIALLPLLDL
jgi:hypothetical protein